MTHPKQLENVKKVVLANFTVDNHTAERVAQAVIEAAYRPLPIEDAPKDGTEVLAVQKGNKRASMANARVDTFRVDTCSEDGRWFREWPEARYVGWIPLPTQEGE